MTKEEIEEKERKEREEKERKEREEKERKERDEKKTEKREKVLVSLDELKEVVKGVVEETVVERLTAAGIGKVDRSKVAVKPGSKEGDTRYAGEGGRVSPAIEALYRSLPEWERKLRTPETDHYIAEWAIGVCHNDRGRMARAHDEINKIMGVRDLNISDDSALIPSPLAAVIVEQKRKIQLIGPRARHFTSTSNSLGIPVDTGVAGANQVAEAGTITPSDPTFGTVPLVKVKTVVATRSSVEFIEDNAFNAVGFLAEQAAGTLARSNDAQDSVDGDGTPPNQSDALEVASSIATENSNVGVTVFSDITALWYGLLSQNRANSYWMGNSAMVQILGDLLDGNGKPIFQVGTLEAQALSGGQGAPGVGTIFGRPLLELVDMTAGTLILGDLQQYGVLEDAAIRAEASTHESFLTDEVTFKWVQRRDGAVLQGTAFRKSLLMT